MTIDAIDERFEADSLNEEVWLPYYLPHWSSRSESAATYDLVDGQLRLSIPEGQGLWCADRHEERLRVSCIQSGAYSGPVGTTIGQQPIHYTDTVREEQPVMWGYTPRYGHIEVTMRGSISPRSMFAFWMVGLEDQAGRSGEICVAEIFGDTVGDGKAEVGVGIHAFRDPFLTEEFSTIPLLIDVSTEHTYGVRWLPDSVSFIVDGEVVRVSGQSPSYPMQLMLGLFDFPDRADENDPVHVPEMWVSRVFGRSLEAP